MSPNERRMRRGSPGPGAFVDRSSCPTARVPALREYCVTLTGSTFRHRSRVRARARHLTYAYAHRAYHFCFFRFTKTISRPRTPDAARLGDPGCTARGPAPGRVRRRAALSLCPWRYALLALPECAPSSLTFARRLTPTPLSRCQSDWPALAHLSIRSPYLDLRFARRVPLFTRQMRDASPRAPPYSQPSRALWPCHFHGFSIFLISSYVAASPCAPARADCGRPADPACECGLWPTRAV